MPASLSKAAQTVKNSKKEDVVEKIAQAGYVAKGVLYVIIGVLSLRAAIGFGGDIKGSKGAIEFLATQPFGEVLLVLMALGLACYAAWRVVKVISGPAKKGEGKEEEAKALGKRVGYGISALTHAALCVFVVSLLVGTSSEGGSGDVAQKMGEAMTTWWGPWVVGLVGVGLAIASAVQFKHAWSPDIREKLDTTDLEPDTQTWIERVYRVGAVARGVVFAILSFFILRAAYYSSSSEVTSSEDALKEIFSLPYGEILLGLVSAGLLCYGVGCLIKGRYRSVSALEV